MLRNDEYIVTGDGIDSIEMTKANAITLVARKSTPKTCIKRCVADPGTRGWSNTSAIPKPVSLRVVGEDVNRARTIAGQSSNTSAYFCVNGSGSATRQNPNAIAV